MAYDEDTHLNVIKFFAQHPNPFFTQQPRYLDVNGAVAHDPSYLYHYIMSFPWRVISHLTNNFTTQVISLRLINVAFMAIGLYLFRLLLLQIFKNKLVVNLALLVFVMTPLVSQLQHKLTMIIF